MTDKSDLTDALREKLHDAIQRVYAEVDEEYRGAMLNRFVLVPEFMTADGGKSIFPSVSPDCRIWEAKGLLVHTLDMWNGQTTYNEFMDMGGSEGND